MPTPIIKERQETVKFLWRGRLFSAEIYGHGSPLAVVIHERDTVINRMAAEPRRYTSADGARVNRMYYLGIVADRYIEDLAKGKQ